MKLRNAWKILPILSAVSLAAGFVVYRNQQASTSPGGQPATPEDKMVMPSSKNPARPMVFPSSKGLTSGDQAINRNNIDAILNNPARQTNNPDEKTLLPSSKIGAILSEKDVPKGKKTVFPSSKSIDAVFSPGSGNGSDFISPTPPPLELPPDSEKEEGATPKP